jgi:formate hydrogenlyase subunit 3/multisubunit Na+/H+ antiporter MnhD subunit
MTLLLFASLVPLLLASALGVVLGGRKGAHVPVYGLSAFAGLAALAALPAAMGGRIVLPLGLPWLGVHLALDPLSGFFLAVVGIGGALASLYALGQAGHESRPRRVLPFFPVFLAGMMLVPLAADVFSFLFSWELMSLASWALVMAHHEEEENRRAGYVYLVMAGFGALCLLLGFGLLAGGAGAYDFEGLRAAAPLAPLSWLALVLVLAGAGSKAGLAPLHVWLPLAHPAAPTPVSALMSGVMTKLAVYAVLRVAFDFLGTPPWWAGLALLGVGALTAVMGILQALLQTDIKKLLACSTIENIGVVFIGIGLAMGFRAEGMAGPAALALGAALFHILNHMLAKSLLFFGAGAAYAATGSRNLEKLGGLIHRMPVTAAVTLAGCLAVCALPPFNGFVSEWLSFQAILQSPEMSNWGMKILAPASGALLALATALAGACFLRFYGIGFLGRARGQGAAEAAETGRLTLGVMGAAAAACLLLGVFPGLMIDALAPVTSALLGGAIPPQGAREALPWLTIVPVAESRSSYNGILVLIFVAVSGGAAAAAIHRFASRRLRRAPAWDCGFPDPDPAAQHSAAGFAQALRRVFGTSVFAASETVFMPPPGDPAPARLSVSWRDRAWDGIYLRVAGAVEFAAGRLNRFQFLTIRRYLSLVFGFLVLLLLGLALWS